MKYTLILMVLNAATGEPLEVQEVATFPSPEACLEAQVAAKPQAVIDGKARVFVCARPAGQDI